MPVGQVHTSDVPALIGKLYETALSDEQPWHTMIQSMVSAVGARTGWLILSPLDGNTPSILGSTGAGLEAIQAYSEHYWAKDPWLSGVMGLPRGDVFASHTHMDAPDFANTEIFADYVRPFFGDTTWALAASLSVADGAVATLGMHRLRSSGAFSAEQAARMQELVPHVRQALLLRDRVGSLPARRDDALGILAKLQTIAFVLGADGQVRFATPSAAALLVRDVGLRMVGSRLTATRRQAQTALDNAIARAAAPLPKGSMFPLVSGPEVAPLIMLVTPYRPDAHRPADREVLCLIRDPNQNVLPSMEHVMAAFGLTKSEGRLAITLAGGLRLPDIASRQGVSMATIRSQLSSILAKTGCDRQSDLVRLLLTLPAAEPQ